VLSTLRTAALLDRVIARGLSPFNLHHAQFNALMLLRRQGASGLRPSVLGDFLCVSRPNVTKLLARLKMRGLIQERPDPGDGRAVLALATPDGEAIAEKAFASLSGELAAAVATLADEDGEALRVLLVRFRNGLARTLAEGECEASD
jgi:DNA-binding MarR family transcriptional regulator